METVENKYITVAYKLYTMEDGEKELFEEAKAEHPFQFISGLGTTLEDFENQITALSKGDKFDFTIPADKAYGQYDEQHVIDLPKNIFEIDGKFDSERIKEGNIVPLMTGDGQLLLFNNGKRTRKMALHFTDTRCPCFQTSPDRID